LTFPTIAEMARKTKYKRKLNISTCLNGDDNNNDNNMTIGGRNIG